MGFFSVNVFNRKKLMVDTDAEAIAKSADMLTRAGVPHEVHTKRFRNHVPNMMRGGSFVDYGISQATMNPVENMYTYTVWVSRKSFDKARNVLGI